MKPFDDVIIFYRFFFNSFYKDLLLKKNKTVQLGEILSWFFFKTRYQCRPQASKIVKTFKKTHPLSSGHP